MAIIPSKCEFDSQSVKPKNMGQMTSNWNVQYNIENILLKITTFPLKFFNQSLYAQVMSLQDNDTHHLIVFKTSSWQF